MKTRNKALVLTLCAVLLVVATVMGTLAYLTGNDKVTNTFTMGNITMVLDEAPVDANGKATAGNRVKSNSYHLVPGNAYDKDPTVHITANSDNCWVFVKVENGIDTLEAATSQEANGYKRINDQIILNNWTKLEGVDGVDNVYYKEYAKTNKPTVYVVFNGFTIADDANTQDAWKNYSPDAKPQVVVTAYAIQKDGFATAAAAWAQVSTANP